MKLQSAIEFLMTYGWAVLILAVVLAALYALGVLNPGTYAAQECVFSSGFSCLDYYLTSNGILHINLQQSTADPIKVTALACVQSGVSGNYLTSNQYLTVGSNAIFAVQCRSTTGNFVSSIGGSFGGTVFVNYTDQLTKLPGAAVGKIAVKVSSV